MFVIRLKHPHKPGGRTVHLFWPMLITVRWDTDWEFRFLPPIFDIAILVLLAHLFLFLV